MTDHAAARQALATAFDFELDANEADSLASHLRGCTACRAFDASMRADGTVLHDLDFGPVPVAVRANVAIAAERRGAGTARWLALVAVGALLLVTFGSGVLGTGGRGAIGLGANGNPVHWQTEVVNLRAADFWIEANGQRFTASSPTIQVTSDPGNATYRTLEVTWFEYGVEMRLNLYFGGDETTWWISEVRVYDGRPQGEWITWEGTWFRTPIGGSSAGDLDLAADGGALHIGGMVLGSTPFDAVNEPGLGVPIPIVRPDLFAAGGLLRCSGILQMTPADAEAALLRLGYRLSWRLERTTGPNTGFSEPMARAPDGVIFREGAPGSSGELIMFVAPLDDPMAAPIPFPDDCPRSDPDAVPPAPASPVPAP